ncbi:Protein CBG27524 [Caenorhabditis briggsae]|uniref:Protein CBG27524 n=1 Tax=Caenorhabditis briggsae TaxID=6238 RepID=B6IKI5_CAEBR|nr:Protein CBG27524 [Caenorhabditis briggsae]CAS00415.1 Protein CBG27524 [Caenorhabditis briggsae]
MFLQSFSSSSSSSLVVIMPKPSFKVVGHEIANCQSVEAPLFQIEIGGKILKKWEHEMTYDQRQILEAYRQENCQEAYDGEADFNIDTIYAHRYVKGVKWFLISFEGFGEPFWRYWKAEFELGDCRPLIQKYERKIERTRGRRARSSTIRSTPTSRRSESRGTAIRRSSSSEEDIEMSDQEVELTDKEVRKIRKRNSSLFVYDRSRFTSAPLKRMRMADGSWKTLPWEKPEGWVDIPLKYWRV